MAAAAPDHLAERRASPQALQRSSSRRKRSLRSVGVVVPGWVPAALIYLTLSSVRHHEALGDITHRATGWVSSDSTLFAWWLHWTPWALGHGQNPFYTYWLNAPTGVNAMWNTTVPVLGMVLSPITLTAGPVAAFNVGMVLGPAVSATLCFACLRPYAPSWAARVVAGGLYGFGPFLIAHGATGHLNLVWAVLPPLLLWALRAAVSGRRPWRDGALFGLVLVVQAGLYTQTLALGAVAGAVALLVMAFRWPGELRRRASAVGSFVLAAISLFVVVCAYPLYLVLAGPGRPRGVIRDPTTTATDLVEFIAPTPLMLLDNGFGGLGRSLFDEAPAETTSYVGIAMLLVAVAVPAMVRSSAVRVVAVVGVVLAVLSLGTSVRVLGFDTGLTLPWRALEGVPLLEQAEALRLGVFVALCLAVLVAVALDRVLAGAVPGPGWVRILAGLAVVAAVATWVPAGTQLSTDARAPEYFMDGAPGLTPDDVVAVWPRPTGVWVDGPRSMGWQSASGMAFRQIGGYFIGTGQGSSVVLEAPPNSYDQGFSAPSVAAARRDLELRRVTAVLVVPQPDVPLADVLTWSREVTGDPGVVIEGVWLFRM